MTATCHSPKRSRCRHRPFRRTRDAYRIYSRCLARGGGGSAPGRRQTGGRSAGGGARERADPELSAPVEGARGSRGLRRGEGEEVTGALDGVRVLELARF